MSANERVLEEIKNFLKALDSYPARFAADPKITFQQHRASLIAIAQAASQTGSAGVASRR